MIYQKVDVDTGKLPNMFYTRHDIYMKDFTQKNRKRDYDQQEVDLYLDDINKDYAVLMNTYNEIVDENNYLQKTIKDKQEEIDLLRQQILTGIDAINLKLDNQRLMNIQVTPTTSPAPQVEQVTTVSTSPTIKTETLYPRPRTDIGVK